MTSKALSDKELKIFQAHFEEFLAQHNVIMRPVIQSNEYSISAAFLVEHCETPISTAESSVKQSNEPSTDITLDASPTGEVYVPESDNTIAQQDIIEANTSQGVDTKMADIAD